jgi:hypothetical protein
MDKMLSESDIKAICGTVRIVKFQDLSNCSSMEEILPKARDCCILFLPTESEFKGHWTALSRSDDIYTFFDSYGKSESNDFLYISPNVQTDYLKKLLTGCNAGYNHVDFQGKESNTCGRWSASYIYLFKKGYNLSEYQKIMRRSKKRFGYPTYDELIVAFT